MATETLPDRQAMQRTHPVRSGLRGHSPLVWILLVGGVARVASWAYFDGKAPSIWDEHDYDRLAANLVLHHEYASTVGTPTAMRPPLYPAFLAAVYSLFGVGNYQAVRLFQVGLGLLNVAIAYRLGTRAFGRSAGTCLAGLLAVYPSMVGFNNLLLTEVLFTTLLCASCTFLVESLESPSLPKVAAAGVTLGLGALTRSVLWIFPAPLILFLLLAWRLPLRRRLVAASVFAAAFAATIAPWSIRNTRLERTFIPIDTMGGRNFMMGNYEYTPLYRAWDAISIEGARNWYEVLLASDPSVAGTTQGQRDKRAFQYGKAYVLAHPAQTFQRDVMKFFNFWGLERELVAGLGRGYFGSVSAPALVGATVLIFGGYALAMLAGAFGMVMAPPADRRVHLLLLMVVGFICAMHAITFGHSRYHLPLMPIVLAYAASAAVNARDIWARKGEWSFLLAVALCGLFVAGWAFEIVFVDAQRFLNALKALA
jgi:4-amino-4-deoxy-L-arabinose transferase-like glycosyltransferase